VIEEEDNPPSAGDIALLRELNAFGECKDSPEIRVQLRDLVKYVRTTLLIDAGTHVTEEILPKGRAVLRANPIGGPKWPESGEGES
jgi:hypothetical protein